MKVLLVKTSSLGDVVHTLPALTDAQRALPGIQFDWVVEEGFAEIPAWHPAVAQVIPVAIRRWRKHPLQTLRKGEWQRFKARLREGRYDLVIDAQGLLKSAWLTRYVKAPVAGLDRESAREPIAARFYDRCYAVPRDQHALERVRQLFAQALAYPLPQDVADYGLDREQMAAPSDQPYLLFLHGTTWPSKHWPEAYWRELTERMSDFGWAIRLPWGNAEEKARAERIVSGIANAAVLPKLNLAGIARVLDAICQFRFTPEQLAENYGALLDEVIRLKPASAKGIYLKKITVSATQGPGVPVDTSVEKNYATK